MPGDGTPVMESGGNSDDARSAMKDKSSSTAGKYFMVLEFMHSMILLLSMMMSNQHHRLLFDGRYANLRSFESDRRYQRMRYGGFISAGAHHLLWCLPTPRQRQHQ